VRERKLSIKTDEHTAFLVSGKKGEKAQGPPSKDAIRPPGESRMVWDFL